ncbi:hypothetical protein T12_4880 [Trichinella patagoniensis]|uniref:Uncharacterized protein n=1 Tax=Trichinella patagoniensis TaxID=990121 RepID=A0A0V1AFP1_9BILA|nr:hypothetical protein T12_4880 [Trichinella patagoniensis]
MTDNKMDNSMMTVTPSKIPTTTTNSSGAGKKFPIKLAWLLSMFTLETILENIKKYLTSKTEQPRDVEEKNSKSDKTPANDGDQMLENNNTWKEIIEHLSKNNMKLLKPIEKKLIMKKKLKFENQHELMEKISKVCKAQLNDYQFDSLLLLCFHLRKVLDFCPKPNAMLNEMVINLLPCLYSKKIVPKINSMTMTKNTLKKKACIILKLLILHPTILKSFNENNELLNNTTTNNYENGTVQKPKRHWDIFSFTKNNKSYDLLSIEERVNSYMKRNQLNNDQLTTETAKNTLKQVGQWVMFISKYMEEWFEYRFDNEIKLANEKISLTNEQIGIFDKESEFKDEMKNEKKYQNQKVITLNVKAVCSYRRKEQQHSQQLDKEKKINKSDYVGHVKRLVLFFEKFNQKKPY